MTEEARAACPAPPAGRVAELHLAHRQVRQAFRQLDEVRDALLRLQALRRPEAPDVPEAGFAILSNPRGRPGGDLVDLFRLDEAHVGLYLADTLGHGLAAGLLALFVREAFRAKEVVGWAYRLLPPDEVLRRLNRALLALKPAEPTFLTMVAVLYNHQDGGLRLARAGHPYPLYLPRAGEPELWRPPGGLLGLCEADFTIQTHRLAPGDRLILYSDGLTGADRPDLAGGSEPLLAAATRWRSLPLEALVDRLAGERAADTPPADDVTVVGLEHRGPELADRTRGTAWQPVS